MIENLSSQWKYVKDLENKFKYDRLLIETEIELLTNLQDGSNKFGESMSITVSNKKVWDDEVVKSANIQEDLFPFDYVLKPNAKKMKNLQENFPVEYAKIIGGLTITPSKPSFKYTGE